MRPRKNLQLLCAQAIEFHNKGNLTEADRLYSQILAIEPGNFTARHLLGVVRHQQGQDTAALELIDSALEINPSDPGALTNYGFVLSVCGRYDEALASFDKALKLDPGSAEAWNNRGITLSNLGCFEEALKSYEKGVAINPNHAEAWNNRGIALQDLRCFNEALESYTKALMIKPDYAEACNNRGITLRELKRLKEALMYCNKALRINADLSEAWNNRGIILSDMKCFGKALESYEKAIAIKPNDAEAFYNRGTTLRELKRLDEALASYEKALAIKPNFPAALSNRGIVLSDLGRFEEALSSYDKALVIRPDYTEALNNRGATLKYLGKFEEARVAYLQSLEIDSSKTDVYLSYSDLVKFTVGDHHLRTMETVRDRSPLLSDADQLNLDFALAKAYADLKDYKRSFQHLLSGNALKRSQVQYDESAELAFFDRIESTFTVKLLREKEKLGGGTTSSVPIFILGMMRSGSTLIEQILASHPDVHGAGELRLLKDVVGDGRQSNGDITPYPECAFSLDAHAINKIGTRYLTEIHKLTPDIPHITDKMPANYFFIGLIHLALPNARIIHIVRDPVDTCISCFSKLFTSEQNHTYDLAELGRYYRRYQKLMSHWRHVLPQGRILDVQYEDVVADLEGQVRRILAHCELDWDARCLSFYSINRPVRTASASQVRRPIYQNAVGRAHYYEEFLSPLKDALVGK